MQYTEIQYYGTTVFDAINFIKTLLSEYYLNGIGKLKGVKSHTLFLQAFTSLPTVLMT